MSRLILVSNRLPITVRRQGRERIVARSTGGLVTGLGPIHDLGDGLWIGTLGPHDDLDATELAHHRLATVPLPKDKVKRHYDGFSNAVIWPLFHYFQESVEFDPRDWQAYQSVNERFADVIAAHARPGDRIWVHDYHFMLLPQLLRTRLPDAQIGFFLHIPFPSSEVFRTLPVREAMLRGLLGANLIGVHTHDYARHLTIAARRILGVEFDENYVARTHHRCQIGVFPLGVDAKTLKARAGDPAVSERLEVWRKRVQGRKVILGVDRMDYTKGLLLRLDTYRHLLEHEPDWRDRVMFLQLAVPTRASVSRYQSLKTEFERRVGEINGAFASEGFSPVQYMYRSISPDELAALYRLADVMMVTPLRDGMNLVAKEYVASRQDDSGVLILSEFAGASSELGEALTINPWDVAGTARTLKQALRMSPEEQAERMSSMRQRVGLYDVHRWGQHFLSQLETDPDEDPTLVPEPVDAVTWIEDLLTAYTSARRVLIALDYDGTLIDLKDHPDQAVPDAELVELLAALGSLPNLDLALISGRDRRTLGDWFATVPVHLIAEHGFVYRAPIGSDWEELFPGLDRSWIPTVRATFEEWTARTPGSFIEEKLSSIAWHYRQVEPGLGMRQARELANHLALTFANSPVHVLHGARVVEARPLGINKGIAYQTLERKFSEYDFVLAAGDDRTDEDLFQVLPADAWSIKVGAGPTQARSRLSTPKTCRSLLATLITLAARRAELTELAPLLSVGEPRSKATE